MMRRPNRMKLHEALEVVRRQGKRGDTELAHVNPREKAILKAMGGVGTRNPKTGLRQYYDGSDFGGSLGGYGEGAGMGAAPDPTTPGGSMDYGGGAQQGTIEYDGNLGAPPAQMGQSRLDQMVSDVMARPMPPEQPGFMQRTLEQVDRAIRNPASFERPSFFISPAPAALYSAAEFLGGLARGAGIKGSAPEKFTDPFQPGGERSGVAEGINTAMAAAPDVPAFQRAGEVGVPMEISSFMGPGLSDLQRRALISTYGAMGTNPAFRTRPAQQYYASLLSRELVNPNMTLNQTPNLLPIEQRYLAGVMGLPQTAPADIYQGIRQFL